MEPDRKTALLGTLALELKKIQEHPQWGVLKEAFEDSKRVYVERTTRDILSGGEVANPIDQRKVDFRRGYLRACEDLFSYPDQVIAHFEKAMERKSESG